MLERLGSESIDLSIVKRKKLRNYPSKAIDRREAPSMNAERQQGLEIEVDKHPSLRPLPVAAPKHLANGRSLCPDLSQQGSLNVSASSLFGFQLIPELWLPGRTIVLSEQSRRGTK